MTLYCSALSRLKLNTKIGLHTHHHTNFSKDSMLSRRLSKLNTFDLSLVI